MEKYFGISYCFNKEEVHTVIENIVTNDQKGYICVADGVTLSMCHRNQELKSVLDHSILNLCDSGWVPLYLKSLYKINREQYCGSDLLMNIVEQKRYNLMFLGSSLTILNALKGQLEKRDERIASMTFSSLPFLDVDDFDYTGIAKSINEVKPDIVFVSLGMPKQEFFISRLTPYIEKGLLIGVGAAFKFHSGLANEKRAPRWMIKSKVEWIYRILSEPKKQIKRCSLIFSTMPVIYWKEYKYKSTVK